jgi:hypothetical protein
MDDAFCAACDRWQEAADTLEDYMMASRDAGGPLAFLMPDGSLVAYATDDIDWGLAIVPAHRVRRLA